MANVGGGKRGGGIGVETTRSIYDVVEEIVPSSTWSDDANNHYLLVDLPDFAKEELKLEVDESNQITVSGKRLVKDKKSNVNKRIYFEKTFQVPKNSYVDSITGKFDGEILYVTVPKQVPDDRRINDEIKEDDQNHDDHNDATPIAHDEQHPSGEGSWPPNTSVSEEQQMTEVFDREILRQWANQTEPLRNATEMLKRNKGILLTAVLAFSIGMLVSRGINSLGLFVRDT